MFPPSLLVIHNARARGQDDVAELSGRQEFNNPFLKISQLHVVAGIDDASLVQTAVELDHYLAAAVVVDFFEFADVAWNSLLVK